MTLILSQSSSNIPLAWRLPARIGWFLLASGCMLIFILSTFNTIRTPLPSCSVSVSACPVTVQLSQEDVEIAAEIGLPFSLILVAFFFSISARLSLAVVGLVIFWRKSGDWVALLLSGALMTVLVEGTEVSGNLGVLNRSLFAIGAALFFILPFVFPNGRFIPSRFRWGVILLTVLYSGGYFFFIDSPQFIILSGILSFIWIVSSIYAILYRYFRVSNAIERQQTKWAVVGLFSMMVTASYYIFYYSLFPPSHPSEARVIALLINLPLYLGGYGILAFSLLLAMLRHRLWDIDILIRRTLQYGLLSTTLALIYFGSVVLVQTVVNGISGRTQSSQLTIALSTLLIAALFNPLRRRIQAFIDRRFYRRKYNAAQTLAQFAQTARDEVDMDNLAFALIAVVEETMRPKQLSLWLKLEKAVGKQKV